MSNHFLDRLLIPGIAVFVILFIIGVVYLAWREDQQCRDKGGQMLRIHCRDETCIISHVSCGEGCSIPIWGTCTTCDNVCWLPNSDGVFKEENRPR